MELSPLAIVSVDDVNSYLKKTGGDVADEGFITDAINIATSTIEDHIRGPVKVRDVENEILDGNGLDHIYPRKAPIVSLLSDPASVNDVQWRPSPADPWETLEDDLNYIVLSADKPWAIWLYRRYFTRGFQNIRLNYKAGYQVIPGRIRRVAIEIVAEMYKESGRGEGRLGRTAISRSTGGIAATDTYVELQPRHRMALAPYRWRPA